jgi:drug/metabolite transporter (DMT)-like permease
VALLASAAFLGLVATALVFALQIAAQRHTTPTHTALIFALEPVCAALFSALAGEHLGQWTLVGGTIMVAGVVVAEIGG